MKDLSRTLPTFQLRRIAACNLVKATCLGERHVPGKAQFDLMFKKFSQVAGISDLPDPRTWDIWLAGTSQIQASKIDLLDRVFERETNQNGVIRGLIEAWPVDHPKRPQNAPIHLHFDALDAAGYWGGGSETDWVADKQNRADTIFRTLHRAWNPSSGPVYSTFNSDMAIRYEQASEEEREKIRQSFSQFQPNPFERILNTPPSPNRQAREFFQLAAPASVWEFLFSLSIDHDFLVSDRLDRWALDLATVGAAMYAVAYSNRYDVFGSASPAKEILIVAGVNELFWKKETDLLTVLWRFGIGQVDDLPLEVEKTFSRLWEARQAYWELMSTLGISLDQISEILDRQWEKRPIIFQ